MLFLLVMCALTYVLSLPDTDKIGMKRNEDRARKFRDDSRD